MSYNFVFFSDVNLLVKFAYLENKFGDKERFQTLFEQVLSSYPKRTDIWISYVDATVKNENIDMARYKTEVILEFYK